MDSTVSRSNKIDLSHILFHSNFVACLTCKRFFGSKVTSNDHNENNALTHVKGKKHRKIVKSMFKTLINDPFSITSDVKYLAVLKNLKLDISQLAVGGAEKQTTYIIERNKCLFCSICQETVSTSTNFDQIKTDLLSHLTVKVIPHISAMKDMASWIYNLNNTNGFILFDKTKVYCSVCDIDLAFVDNLMLHSAVGHLQTNQHKVKLFEADAQDLIVRANGSGGLGLSALPKKFNVEDNEIVQKFVNSHENIDKMTLDSIRSLARDPLFAQHVQFYKIESGNFICTLCNVPLTLSKSNSDHLKTHILGSPHRNNSAEHQIFVPDRSQLNATESPQLVGTTPHDQIQKLALEPEFALHVKYLQIKGNTCRCILCDVTLSVSIKVNHNIKDHLLGDKHIKKFEALNPNHGQESLTIVGESASTVIVDKFDIKALSQDPVVGPHLKNILKKENHYFCSMCSTSLYCNKNIKEHVLSRKHRTQLGKLNNQISDQEIPQFKKLAQNPACVSHIKYFTMIGKQCQCNICSVVIPKSANNIKMHILGSKHAKSLGKLLGKSGTVQSQLSLNGQTSANPTPSLPQTQTLNQDPICAPHLPYLRAQDKHYYCSICSACIPMEKKGFMQHILGTKHMKRFEKLQPGIAQVQNIKTKQQNKKEKSNPQNSSPNFISTMAQDPRCAPHVKYFKKEKKQCRCTLCGVPVPNLEHDVLMHIRGSKHKKSFKLTQISDLDG